MNTNWADYLVVWMDVLGAGELLEPIIGKIHTEYNDEDHKVLSAYEAKINKIRKLFQDATYAFEKPHTEEHIEGTEKYQTANIVTREQVERVNAVRRAGMGQRFFVGDGMCYAIPIRLQDGKFNSYYTIAFWRMVHLTMLTSLAIGLPIRAGVSIGVGRIENDLIIGPAIADAYRLESSRVSLSKFQCPISNWCRVVVSPAVYQRYLDYRKTEKSTEEHICAKSTLPYLVRGEDGSLEFDYVPPLTPTMLPGSMKNWHTIYCAANVFAKAQLAATLDPKRKYGWECVCASLKRFEHMKFY